jgi:Uma2 family endonuclease
MGEHIENDETYYYYDSHVTEKDLMGEPSNHSKLVHYLWDVLLWLFHGQQCAIYKNLNFYHTSNRYEYPQEPDLAVIKGVDFQHLRSWRVGKTGPAPHVVFEIMAEETWKEDLQEKAIQYALMGVEEYFAYDPNNPPLDNKTSRRLFGWSLDKERRVMCEMPPLTDSSLWSVHLNSFLASQGAYLRLYDKNRQQCLTRAAAMQTKADALRVDIQVKRIKAMEEKLRSLGIDPDQL